MIQENFVFLSKNGKTKIHAVKWMPDTKEYTAVLQITHGMQEYIERYTEYAEYMTKQGFLVVGHDHLGHGESVLSAQEYGFFAEEHPSDVLVEDMHTLRTIIQKENPDVPYFMLGHSMGSYMLRKYITLHNDKLRGIIIVGTGCMPDMTMKLGMRICSGMARIKGWHYVSRLMKKLSFMGAYKKFDTTGKDIEKNWLTRDLELAKKFYTDPKANFSFTVNGYYGLMEAVLYDNQPQNIAKIPKKLPIFFVSGEDDPVGDLGKGVKKAYSQYEEAGLVDITWKLYPQARHEILNEVNRKEVYEEIFSWINVRKTT